MRIQVSSNVINGLYSCVEVILVTFLAQFLTVVIGCWNVRTLHDKKGEVRLSRAPLPYFSDPGLSSRTAHRVCVLLFSAVVVLMVCGEFSIVGVTEKQFQDVKVGNVVRRAPPGQAVNLEEHISLETGSISGTVRLLAEFAACSVKTTTRSVLYEYKNNLQDLTTIQVSAPPLGNSTCLIAAENFKDSVSLEFDLLKAPAVFFSPECVWRVNVTALPFKKPVSVRPILSKECPVPIVEAWCIRDSLLSCAAFSEFPGGLLPSLVRGDANNIETQLPWRSVFGTSLLVDYPTSTILKSIAMLQASGQIRGPFDTHIVAMLRVETNAVVEQYVGDKDVTDLDVLFFCLTAGVALVLTVITGMLALVLWVQIIVIPSRKSYNRFNSVTDFINLAAAVAYGEEDLVNRTRSGLRIGISSTEPHVGPLEEDDAGGGSKTPEDELVGHMGLQRF